jgi:hypothetical protein
VLFILDQAAHYHIAFFEFGASCLIQVLAGYRTRKLGAMLKKEGETEMNTLHRDKKIAA